MTAREMQHAARVLKELIDQLPEDERKVIECVWFEQLTKRETARYLGYSNHKLVIDVERRALARLEATVEAVMQSVVIDDE